jgi:hypothetical protein
MKQVNKIARLCIMATATMALSGCASDDNPVTPKVVEEIGIKNFSNTGCKPSQEILTRAEQTEELSSIELSATERDGIYVVHRDVILNCGIKDYNAVIEVDGNKITVTETGDASMQAWCNCAVDFGYEIGPLVEGNSYELIVLSEHNRSANKIIKFVYSPTLKYVE